MLRIVSTPLAGLALTLAPAAAIGAEELPEEARCLALAMYWEAKDQGREGMLAVGSVVLNRMRHEEFPDAPCEVVREGGRRHPASSPGGATARGISRRSRRLGRGRGSWPWRC
jgi:hypothetical protein